MNRPQTEGPYNFAAVVSTERPRLVRLCAQLSGDQNVAEDLAQETLLEAWRLRHRLTDEQGYQRWLTAIARNVCLRWRRACRHIAREYPLLPEDAVSSASGHVVRNTDEFDITVDLDRDDLARLLDQALAWLSPHTRAILVERYIKEGSCVASVQCGIMAA
jgi:RNA polymerase sigma factor (sigma-70 family)